MLWPIYVLAFVAAGVSASDVFLYSRHSCDDLIPRHPVAIEKADAMMTNHVQQPTPTKKADTEGANANATTTSTTTTTTTTQPPPPAVPLYTGGAEVKVMTSENTYRRLKSLRGMIPLLPPIFFFSQTFFSFFYLSFSLASSASTHPRHSPSRDVNALKDEPDIFPFLFSSLYCLRNFSVTNDNDISYKFDR